ncbi:preprotein translocase subunit SecG [Dokdonella koreensis]|jgi:preprotein translocase subunit SecG|uniref:Protein-export membrane protein SecG n=1 Tax=Dokdonella koreensis DS-123 TaxID=1300342 RepID=A0A160DSS4_9GAMM|nr:preprotein translocase subunit SecG [Dokdonella koreensis]ANB17367.1 Preprotein translocase subunit SecG [Dokdonella koreensis DS-123]
MLTIIAYVFYVLVAIAMIVLILMQRGAGAAAGSGFGGGASATVFGARGSANFLSRSTAVLAGLFFLLSLGMGIYHSRPVVAPTDDLGVMAGVTAPAPPETPAPAPGGDVPKASVPAAGDTPAAQPAPESQTPPADGKPAEPKPEPSKKDGAG